MKRMHSKITEFDKVNLYKVKREVPGFEIRFLDKLGMTKKKDGMTKKKDGMTKKEREEK